MYSYYWSYTGRDNLPISRTGVRARFHAPCAHPFCLRRVLPAGRGGAEKTSRNCLRTFSRPSRFACAHFAGKTQRRQRRSGCRHRGSAHSAGNSNVGTRTVLALLAKEFRILVSSAFCDIQAGLSNSWFYRFRMSCRPADFPVT